MKKYLFTLLLVTGVAGAALACDKDKERKETGYSQNEKEEKAGGAAAGTEPVAGTGQRSARSRDFRQANYLRRDLGRSLFFSGDNARLVAGIEQVGTGVLPAQLRRKLRRNYKGYRIARVTRYTDSHTLYFVVLEKDQENVLLSFSR